MCGQSGHLPRDGEHWNTIASAHKNENEKTTEELITEIRARRDWIGVDFLRGSKEKEDGVEGEKVNVKTVRLLDYACGTGMVSRAFGPYVTECKGIDLSRNMVQEYNTRVGQSTNRPGNICFGGFEGEEFHNFDLVVVGLGFHHFEDPVLAGTRLVARLKEGGCLLIIDFLLDEKSGEGGEGEGVRKGNGNGHSRCHGIGKHHRCGNGDAVVAQTKRRLGFEEEEMRDIFSSAGVGKDFDFEVIAKGAVFETQSCSMIQDVFMARGTKA